MAKITNKDMLNGIRATMSAESQEIMPVATGDNSVEVYAVLENYPSVKNEFINTLTNRIGKQMFFDKLFNNPFKMLHKGMLPFGKSIEQLFVEMAEEKGFNEHFTGSTTSEGDLIGLVKPSVKVDYISQNFEYKFKTSISDLQLKGAFTSEYGLAELITRAVNSLLSSSQYAEFRDMKKILTNDVADSSKGSTIGKGLIQQIYADTIKSSAIVPLGSSYTPQDLAVKVREYSSIMTFPSKKFNLAGVNAWSQKEDLVLFTTPEQQAKLDVNVLAMAFNVSLADVNVRTIIVDDLGVLPTSGNKVVAVLADKDIIQAYDTINTTNTFYNPERLATNYFAHKHGIIAGCKFANAVVFVDGQEVT